MKALDYTIFGLLGGAIALGVTTILTHILGTSPTHIFWGGALATFQGYMVESWAREVEQE